jgi:hypothetical protein
VIGGRTVSIYESASQWFAGLDGFDRAAVSALTGGPLPGWVVDSLRSAQIPTVSAQVPIGAGYRSAEFMMTILSDFLTHEAPALDLSL